MDAVMEWMGQWILMPLVILMLAAMGIGAVVGIPYGIYYWATYKPPETFELRVDSWQCTDQLSRDVERCRPKVGCSWIRETVCDQWSRR
jgi:hypothetical protein